MEVYTSSSGFKHAMGQCSHSAVPLIAYQPQPTSYMIPVALMPVHCSNVYTYAPPSNQQVAYTTPSLPDPIRPASRSSHKMSSYNSLMDPHMQDYYAKKFGRKTKRLRTSREEALYRITIKTADKKDAGTNAKVFLSIYGSKDKICRKPLTRETILRGAMLSASLNRPMIDLSTIEFKRGATDVVYIRCRDLGIIRYIILEHSGVLFEQSWLCECILITNVRTARSWYFFCGKWLSLFPPGDGSLTVELFPGDRIEDRINDRFKSLPETTEFEIICVTGDKRNAGTDANVYITLFGKESKTKKIHLQSRSKNPFERGQSDTFNVKAEYVGELDKIRIEHDNTGSAPGWFLERVVITDRYDPDTKYFASCNKWLARDEGDGQISRDLVCSKDVMGSRKPNKYKVTVITGNKMGAGTDADVYLTLFGQLGESGAILLDDKKNNFEKGATDHFDIECPSVGEIDKILIAHNNKGAAPGWFLDKILIDDIDQRRTYEFRCQKWLATDEGDGQISRFLLPVKGNSSGKQATEGIPYTVSVTTGDKINAGTNARVYLIMYGEQDDNTSGKIFLSDGTFERERTDIFHIDGPYGLSPLAYIDIGHDDSGMNPGWYLGNVVIDCPSTGIKQTFHCDKWLATDEGDRRIERRLFETKREVRPPSVPWYVWVYTSDIRGAGTDSDVSMVLYGSKGKTDDIKLVSKSNSFEAGECDEFKVDAADVGKPYKLRVGHNNKRAFAPWHLDRIEMENLSTKKRYIFHCGKWLSKKDGDKQTIRELPAEGPGIDHPLPVVHYLVDVHTGKKRNAGTDANVFLNIFGDYGDTGERPLEYSSNKNKFENGQVDTFNIEAVTLNRIKKLRVGHDGQGAGAGWFLEKIVVREQENKDTNITFMCNRWLASDEDDGQLVRELTLDGTQHLNKTSYHINIKTGDVLQAGTDADVHIKIFGEKGDSDVVQLRNAENTTNKFERNRIDKFTLEFSDLGKIRAIRIGHNGKGLGSGWFLDYVEIDVPMRGELYRFSCHRWLDSNEGDGLTELELQPSDIQKKTRSIPYEITVFTGDKPNAGTDASVFIQIYGVNGKTEELKLGNKSDTFERKKVDKFKLEATDVGQIVKIRIGHDSKGLGSGWFLEKVCIQRTISEKHDRKKKDSVRTSKISLSDPTVEEYWFVTNQWFDNSKGDRQTVRELLPTDEAGNILGNKTEAEYKVHVFTGDKAGAGTDANVFLTMYGAKEDSGERQLERSNRMNKFERKQEDIFLIKAVHLGELRKIKIRHDNKGGGAAWYLDRVEIDDPEEGKTYHFICKNWLATNEGDGQISREIASQERLGPLHGRDLDSPLQGLERKKLATTYKVNVITSNKTGSGTNANVYIIIFGEHNDTGKVPLATSKTHNDPFESGHTDLFEIEAMDIGEPKKIKIGHDDSGFRSDWLLEEVDIDVPKLGRTFKFPCGQWLSKSKGDAQLEVELYPKELGTEIYKPFVPYEIKVFTSNKRGAGTDANVFIEIYGEDVSTGQTMLCEKTERKGKFDNGSVDTFTLELEDVGERIEKIRIGHDNHGLGAAWHLDHVEIRRLIKNTKTQTFLFPCNRWLARNEDDGSIVRELVPDKVIEEKVGRGGHVEVKEREMKDKLQIKNYEVDVYTGDKFACGTNANVYLTIYGDKGDTGERKLRDSETHRDKFERNQMDRFKIESADLGTIYRVVIRHDNSGISPDWLLNRIEIKDDIRTYLFHCEQWLAKGKGDGKLQRTLYEKDYQGSMASMPTITRSVGGSLLSMTSTDANKREPFHHTPRKTIMSSIAEESRDSTEEGIPYTIMVTTGSEPDAGTTANVFIRLIGRKGKQTPLLPLELAHKRKFEPGKVETFSFHQPDIGDLELVEIQHDGETPATSWLLDEVKVEIPTKGKAYFFPCHEWLSKHKGDGHTKRMLRIQDANQAAFRPLIPYEMTIYTGDVENAGTDCDVSVKLFGTNGASSDHVIKKQEHIFERASINPFEVELDDVGKPRKLRVSIIPKSKRGRKSWYLEKIELVKVGAQRNPVLFGLNDWLSEQSGMSRDIPLIKDGRSVIEETTYRITTKTSDVDHAGSDANVFVVIYGQNGDSGELRLDKSETHTNKFERNHEDVFKFDNILSLGELTKLRIWHDNSSTFKSSWHLESVKVEDVHTGKTFIFPCDKWLSSTKDDKQTVRELKCTTESGSRDTTPMMGGRLIYEIEVITSDKKDAGTTQHGWLILEGARKKSDRFQMKNTQHNKILRKGQTDTFTFETRALGDIRRIILGHEERPEYPLQTTEGREAMWHCSSITVTDTSTGTKYIFPVQKWISINNDGDRFDCADKKEDSVSQQRNLSLINYKIVVYTGNIKGAGTDANVSIILYGTLGDSGKRDLKKKGRNLFEKGQVDEFVIECLDLGELTKLHIEHDNALINPDWFLDKVEVINLDTNETVEFPCHRWLGKNHDDNEIARDLLPIHI